LSRFSTLPHFAPRHGYRGILLALRSSPTIKSGESVATTLAPLRTGFSRPALLLDPTGLVHPAVRVAWRTEKVTRCFAFFPRAYARLRDHCIPRLRRNAAGRVVVLERVVDAQVPMPLCRPCLDLLTCELTAGWPWGPFQRDFPCGLPSRTSYPTALPG